METLVHTHTYMLSCSGCGEVLGFSPPQPLHYVHAEPANGELHGTMTLIEPTTGKPIDMGPPADPVQLAELRKEFEPTINVDEHGVESAAPPRKHRKSTEALETAIRLQLSVLPTATAKEVFAKVGGAQSTVYQIVRRVKAEIEAKGYPGRAHENQTPLAPSADIPATTADLYFMTIAEMVG